MLFKREGFRMCDWEEEYELRYLDVVFNIHTDEFNPFQKPNASMRYINPNSDNPPNVIKDIRKIVEDPIIMLSSNEEIHKKENGANFFNTAPQYGYQTSGIEDYSRENPN